MLKMEDCVLIETGQSALTSDTLNVEEGCALVHVLENGERKMRVATGAPGEFFAGAAINQAGAITSAPIVEEVTIPNSGTVQLAKPLDGTKLRVSFVGGGAVTAGTPGTTAGQYSRSGQILTFNNADKGKKVRIVYRFAVSAREAMFLYGKDFLASDDVSTINNCGFVTTGTIVTSCYDIESDWEGFNASTPIKLGEKGLFTLSGNGTSIDAIVEFTPSVNNGLLAIRLKP